MLLALSVSGGRDAAQHLTYTGRLPHCLVGPEGSSAEAEKPCIRQCVYLSEFIPECHQTDCPFAWFACFHDECSHPGPVLYLV